MTDVAATIAELDDDLPTARADRVEPLPEGIATPAAAGTAVNRRSRDLEDWERGPTRGLGLPLAGVALDPAPGLQGNGLRAATDEDALLRLARGARSEWLEAQRQTQPGRHGR